MEDTLLRPHLCEADGMPSSGYVIAMTDKEAWTRLGREVATRRIDLGETHQSIARKTGTSNALWSRLENGKVENGRMNRSSAITIEKALRWKPGSFEAILFDGDKPTTLEEEPTSDFLVEQNRSLETRVVELERIVRKLQDQVDALGPFIKLGRNLRA